MATLNRKNILNLKNPLTCSHWEEQNYRVFLKIFCFAKNPFTHLDKGCRNAHPFLRFSKKIFYSVKSLPHLFGITKPNDTLFHRKNEKIFFIRLLDGLFLLVKKVPSLIWNQEAKTHPIFKKYLKSFFQKDFPSQKTPLTYSHWERSNAHP